VVGHPTYYPRFDFEPASRFGVRSQWDGIPDDAFLIRFLPGSMPSSCAGIARYLPEFDQAL
jgi:putative acetyltransferase